MPKPKLNSYNVRPRYTGGSPAAVDLATAIRVAKEEREAYEHALSGVYGENEQKRAEQLGLEGIVYELYELGSGKKFRWVQFDALTQSQRARPQDTEMETLGWLSFERLPKWAQLAILAAQPNIKAKDLERRWWRCDAPVHHSVVEFKPEPVQLLYHEVLS